MIRKILITLLIFSSYLFSQKDFTYHKHYRNSINNGIQTFKIEIKGGGGYYTNLVLKLHFDRVPISIKGGGYSDSNDNGIRVGISNFNGGFFDFRDRGLVDLTRFASRDIYVLLDSKWGTDQDSFMKLLVDVPTGCNVNYQVIKHPEGLEYCHITKINNKIIRSEKLSKHKLKKYKIEIKGGGGYYTNLVMKLHFDCVPISIKGSGYSDSNDNGVRVGISKYAGDFYDFRDRGLVDLTRFASRDIYVLLDSKWGTDQDSFMKLLVDVPTGCNVNYQVIKHPEGLEYCHINEINR